VALVSGARLGPYEVSTQIGAGGMGEVYQATDTNLKRAVAIKVLPASLSNDPERLARFNAHQRRRDLYSGSSVAIPSHWVQ
jgi:eukaryotic-like serine/threonine-protein kinase